MTRRKLERKYKYIKDITDDKIVHLLTILMLSFITMSTSLYLKYLSLFPLPCCPPSSLLTPMACKRLMAAPWSNS